MTLEKIVELILAVGTVLPLLTSVVQQAKWSTRIRTIVGVAMSVVAGLVTYVAANGLHVNDVSSILATVLGVVLASIAAYKGIWQPTGVAGAIEAATSPKTPGAVMPDTTTLN